MTDKPAGQELVTPYCGGCGHLYFGLPKIPPAQAREEAGRRRCHYCRQDEAEDKKKRPQPQSPDVLFIDPEF